MDNRPRRLIEVIFEACILFAIGAYLLRLGLCYLYQIRYALLIIGIIAILGIIGVRVCHYRRSQRWRDDEEP